MVIRSWLGFRAVQGSAQQALLRQLVPLVAAVPAAKDRCAALARIWAAAVAADLGARRAVRLRQRPTPQAELKHLLSDAVVLEVISGSSGGAQHHSNFFLPVVNPCALGCWRRMGVIGHGNTQ